MRAAPEAAGAEGAPEAADTGRRVVLDVHGDEVVDFLAELGVGELAPLQRLDLDGTLSTDIVGAPLNRGDLER